MPFKLKLKKSRQYNVTSKSLFVISVHHLLVLDTPTTVDCTLSSESTGQECLDNVCQRLSINQTEFFGLRYDAKDTAELRWIDLERPLSRQLEKHASNTRLYLRIMYYVISGVGLITDEIARNYYFLQLKSDVVEGRISCDPKQAVILAIYCRQAQYDSGHGTQTSSDRHKVDYLKTLLPFPRHMIEAGLLEQLTEDMLQPNADIQNLTQASAEGLFIEACQQLDGYGKEKFLAKDENGDDVTLGITVSGISVTIGGVGGGGVGGGSGGAGVQENNNTGDDYEDVDTEQLNVRSIIFYPWRDISNVVNHKRSFNIECTSAEKSVGFMLRDADTGRYFWKLCVLQHTFYMRYEQNQNHTSEINFNLFPQKRDEPYDSRDNLFVIEPTHLLQQQHQQQLVQPQQPLHLQQIQHSNSNLYASDTHISTIGGGMNNIWQTSDSVVSSNMSLAAASQQQLIEQQLQHHQQHQHLQQQQQQQQQLLLHQNIDPNWIQSSNEYVNRNSNWGLVGGSGGGGGSNSGNINFNGSNASLNNRVHSSSCLDLSNNNNSNNNNNNTIGGHERERLKALLPDYRKAPDYETAVQQKYRTSETELHLNHTNNSLIHNLSSNGGIKLISGGSQPDVHEATALSDAIFGQQLEQHYPDVTHTTQTATAAAHLKYQHGGVGGGFEQLIQMNHFNKPPPPYPANRLSSTSTPDLALASHRALYGYRGAYVSGSSPDLVSSRTFLNPLYMQQNQSILISPQQHQIQLQYHQHQQQQQQQQQQQILSSSSLPVPAFRNRYTNCHVPHGTYENLNFLEQQQQQQQHVQNNANLLAKKTHDDIAYRISQQNELIKSQSHLVAAGLATHSGSIEPIYENIPLPAWKNVPTSEQPVHSTLANNTNPNNTTADGMRERASSIQSAPGVIRFNKQQAPSPPLQSQSVQPQQQQQQQPIIEAHNLKLSALNIHDNSTNNYNLDLASQHRTISKATSNPIVQPPQPSQSHQQSLLQNIKSSLSSSYTPQPSSPRSASSKPQLNQQISKSSSSLLINRSQSTNYLDSSQSSGYSVNTITTDSGISGSLGGGGGGGGNNDSLAQSSSSIVDDKHKEKDKEKKKRRWGGFFGGSKSSLTSTNKQKSATLGRDKDKSNKTAITSEEESNLRYRWSTGLPRLPVALPVTISKEKLCKILETKLSDPQLYIEFERMPKRKENGRYDCALLDENRQRNYDSNFLPYDDNRVRLTPTRENRQGYVNASHITATVGAKQRFYVVAQSPSSESCELNIFLQCVWEADVYLLVQLSDEINYVPPTSNKYLEYGQYQVWQEFSQVTDRCITSKLRLYHTQSRRYRSVWHLKYSKWAEQNCPQDVGHFLDFLEELSSIRLASINEVPPGHNTNPPVMIHCSEGVGRSGVVLAADLLLYTLDHNQDLDIPRVVSQLRLQRDNIIPSLAQYKFIYDLLIQYLKRTRLI